jgi:hypothetical protein
MESSCFAENCAGNQLFAHIRNYFFAALHFCNWTTGAPGRSVGGEDRQNLSARKKGESQEGNNKN